MTSKIRVLCEHTINKIAAGEVIENPASVVKELVENSLDAGSTEISVLIKGGGRQLIRITDNGCGMNADDALLCLERHATSKLKEIEDIHTLDTMGFRGEAVPSIASISKFTLITKSTEQIDSDGTMVMVDGGKIIKCCPVACSPGTTIEVKSLFFNVPVRKKFQKSPAYDVTEIHKMLSLLALGNPEIKFELISDQETLLTANVPHGNSFEEKLGSRIRDVLGNEFLESLCPLSGSKGEYRLRGFIGMPAFTRHNRTGQHLFINRRGIFSPTVSYAIRDGYGTTLPQGRHPIYVLHLDIHGSLVDVNVHPQKREVRLRQEHVLKEMVMRSVEEALQNAGYKSTPTFAASPFGEMPNITSNEAFSWPKFVIDTPIEKNQTPIDYHAQALSPQPPKANQAPSSTQAHLFSEMLPKATPRPKVLAALHRYLLLDPSTLENKPAKAVACLIDQRAAHSRVIFEKLQGSRNSNVEVQTLLVPITLDLTPQESAMMRAHLETLQDMGIHIKEFGSHTFAIDALPQIFGNIDVTAFVMQIVKDLHDFSDLQTIEREHQKRIAVAAGRSSISIETRLSLDEAQSLINALMDCQVPHLCPQGKPTMVFLTQEDLAKQFHL